MNKSVERCLQLSPWWNNTILKSAVHKLGCRNFKYKKEEAAQLVMILSVAGTIFLVNGLASMDYMLQGSSGSRIVWENHIAKRF